MNIRTIIILSFLLLCLHIQAQAQPIQKGTKPYNEFKEIWTAFAKAIISKDTNEIRKLSTKCISCSSSDTPYISPNYISIAEFIQDASWIFDSTTTSRLLNNEKLVFLNDDHNSKLYKQPCISNEVILLYPLHMEVLVTIIDHSKSFEGFQKAFAFIETKNGLKFCGYSTIP